MDRRIAKSHDAIKNAMLELLSQTSFDQITIQNIADTANVSRGTIYLHYKDKYDLLNKLILSYVDELGTLCTPSNDFDYYSSLLVWTKYFEEHYKFFSTMLSSVGVIYFREQFHDMIVKQFLKKLNTNYGINKDFEIEIVSEFLGSAFIGLIEWWITNNMPCSSTNLAYHLLKLLERHFDVKHEGAST